MLLLLLLPTVALAAHEVFLANEITIPPKQDLYEFWLEIKDGMTMVITKDESNVLLWDVNERKLVQRSDEDCAATEPFDAVNAGQPIKTGDGLQRRVITINGTLPAPTLVVYEGSKVRVHVKNLLRSRAFMLHFHGMLQTNNVWHDGGGRLSQCPIMPEQTFTYRFVAETPGTYFYHGHFDDRGDGAEGAFIVLPAGPKPSGFPYKDTTVVPDKQYVGFVQDWFPTLFEEQFAFVKWGTNRYVYGFTDKEKCYAETKTFDGSRIGQVAWHSAIVNGRGWYNHEDLLTRPHQLPLETYRITKNGHIAIRFINAGIMFPLAISIDEHEMEVIATDGNAIQPIHTDYLTILPGERYDVLIKGHANPSKWKYYIKFESLETYTEDMQPLKDHHFTMAILRYDDYEGDKSLSPPTGLKFENIQGTKRMVNCPFKAFPQTYPISCINYDNITGNTKQSDGDNASDRSTAVTTINLNMFNDKSINGVRFVYPKIPPLLDPTGDEAMTKSCEADSKKCSNFIKIPLGTTARLVMYNLAKTLEDSKGLDAFAHPIHIHGHHFKVIDVGYPEYDENGLIAKFNDKIICEDDDCNKGALSPEWVRPEPKEGGYAIKDTVPVPVGGYVVIEFPGTNAGWWPMHCHMLPHHMDGMAIAVKVGNDNDMPPKPAGYPDCTQMYY